MDTSRRLIGGPVGRIVLSVMVALVMASSVVPQMSRARIVDTDPSAQPDLEREMLVMINRERSSRGLRLLVADARLTRLARAHSRDMIERRYFAHVTPDGKDPFDRFVDARIEFLAAGENLAFTQTLDIAHDGLMKSKIHRDNILHTAYGRVGIGIIKDRRGLMISQEFKD